MGTFMRQAIWTGALGHGANAQKPDVCLPEDISRDGERLSAEQTWPAWQVLLGVILFCGGFWGGLFYLIMGLFG